MGRVNFIFGKKRSPPSVGERAAYPLALAGFPKPTFDPGKQFLERGSKTILGTQLSVCPRETRPIGDENKADYVLRNRKE